MPKSSAKRAREWMRSLVDDPERRKAFAKAVDDELAEGTTHSYLKALEHGYGRPPQAIALAVNSHEQPGEYRAVFEDGSPALAEAETVPESTGQ